MYKTARDTFCACVAASLLLGSLAAYAQQPASRLTVQLDADSTKADGPNGVIEFSGITIRQGDLSVRADAARSSGLDFENSAGLLPATSSFALPIRSFAPRARCCGFGHRILPMPRSTGHA